MSDPTYFQTIALPFVLQREGGLVDDPNDPGGLTNYGISQRAHPEVDVRLLTPQTVGPIYFADYWTPAGCADLDDGDSLAVFDTAVNLGVSRATKMWAAAQADVGTFLDARRAYYRALAGDHPQLAKFLPGWLKRVDLVQGAVA